MFSPKASTLASSLCFFLLAGKDVIAVPVLEVPLPFDPASRHGSLLGRRMSYPQVKARGQRVPHMHMSQKVDQGTMSSLVHPGVGVLPSHVLRSDVSDRSNKKTKKTKHHKVYVNSYNSKHVLEINVLDSLHLLRRSTLDERGLLDPAADLLQPLAPLIGTLVPVLKGLPLVGGIVDVLGDLLNGLGEQKIGALLTGNPLPASGPAMGAVSNVENAVAPVSAYQIDASNGIPTQMFLAKLPFAFDMAACPNILANSSSPVTNASATNLPIPVSIAIPVMDNSSLSVMCATYNSAPDGPTVLSAQSCLNNTAPASGSAMNMSQVFAWNEATGVLQPLWNATSPDASTLMNCTVPDAVNATDAGAAMGAAAPPTPEDAAAAPTQNASSSVNLVFRVGEPGSVASLAARAIDFPVGGDNASRGKRSTVKEHRLRL